MRANASISGVILGILLAHPSSWHRVQVEMDAGDFGCPRRRRLAEIYWDYQRHEGEPVLKEFIGMLSETDAGASATGTEEAAAAQGLTQLAVELVDDIENLAEIDATLSHCIAYLMKERKRFEQDKQVAQLGRMSQEKSEIGTGTQLAGDGAQTAQSQADALFAKIVKGVRPTDLHRIGPVR